SILLKGHEGPVHCAVFSPDGRTLLSSSADHTVRIWDLSASDPNQKTIILRGHRSSVHQMLLSEDGRLLVTASEGTPDVRDAAVRIWRIRSEDVLAQARQIAGQIFTKSEQEEIMASLRPLDSAAR
ncbi:MAG TPA: hypothetical protein PLQ00_17495, partial [Thermoguttaceae bacterium]|nr:hypothetical protein [Thermoguttaceae bacterium]